MPQQHGRQTTILIVDDDKAIRDVVAAGLTRAGYLCQAADGADTAAQKVAEQTIDLVLLDISMPVKSGLDYLPELKAQHPDVAVVMLTGDADLENAVRTMRDGAFDYIAKPVGLADLIIRVEYALSRRALILDNKAYQQRQKNLVDRLNASVEQRKSELSALSELFKSDMSEGLAAQEAYTQLRDSVETFNLDSLVKSLCRSN